MIIESTASRGDTAIKVRGQKALDRHRRGNTMARKSDVAEVENETVEATEEKAKKEPKQPKRGDLPEGYVTPVGLAKALTEQKLHTNREGEVVEVKPQMVYSYIKNASKEDPFPIETITDSIGAERQVLKLEAGLEWWARKTERVAARKANAAEKAAKKEANAKAKAEAAAQAEEAE